MTEQELLYLVIPRNELADALREDARSRATPIRSGLLPRISNRDAFVCWSRDSRRPCIIGIPDEDRDELFNWAITFHRDLSPLTSWCHVLSFRELEKFSTNGRSAASLAGLEAAWAGAAIAEAMILARQGYEEISLPACLATDTYAIARTASLYGARGALNDTIHRLDQIRERLKKTSERWRPLSGSTIAVLLRLLPDAPPPNSWIQEVLVKVCRTLQTYADEEKKVDWRIAFNEAFYELKSRVPHLSVLEHLYEMSAEQRVKLLRSIPSWIVTSKHEDERQIFFFVAGYVISQIGGAERDLRLAESFGTAYPNVLTWAATLGGLGATTYWADAFGGIGRLVARELARSLDVIEAPTADISADEFLVISGADRNNTNFRTALRHVAAISVSPGVVVQLSTVGDERTLRVEGPLRQPAQLSREIRDQKQLQILAEQLFPFIRNLLIRYDEESLQRDKKTSRRGRPPELPLK